MNEALIPVEEINDLRALANRGKPWTDGSSFIAIGDEHEGEAVEGEFVAK